jgi:hypothetical protein
VLYRIWAALLFSRGIMLLKAAPAAELRVSLPRGGDMSKKRKEKSVEDVPDEEIAAAVCHDLTEMELAIGREVKWKPEIKGLAVEAIRNGVRTGHDAVLAG